MRRWLVVPSIAVHVALIIGLLFLGAWHLDKLEAAKLRVTIGYEDPHPEAEAAGSPRKPTPIIPKTPPKTIPPVIVTPPDKPEPKDETPATPDIGNGSGDGSGQGSGSGIGSGSGTDPKSECTENCDPPVKKVEAKMEERKIVPPTALSQLFRDGNRQPQPADVTKTEMHRDGRDRTTASFQVCLDASGNVSMSRQLKSSGYPAYDGILTNAIAGWHYNPYTIDNRGIPVCSVVTFIYAMK
ncbi:MAG TPA: hypothetical protein VF403_13660 [Kofleriaceae bacterium]